MEDTAELDTLGADKQARLDALMTKNNVGLLNDTEKRELENLVHEAEELMAANARLLTTPRSRLTSSHLGAGVNAAQVASRPR